LDLVVRKNVFRVAYEYAVLYCGLLAFAMVCLLWAVPATMLYWLLPKGRGRRLGQYVIMLGFRAYLSLLRTSGLVQLDLAALDALRDERALIIATNHPSMIDVVLIASRLPRVVCIMKSRLLKNPVLGISARLAGYVRNDPPWTMVRDSVEAVRAGSQLLVFPEGTRTGTPPIDGFREGFGMVAKKAPAQVQAVFIEASSPFLGKGWPLHKLPEFPLRYRVCLGERFEPGSDVRAMVAHMEQYYRKRMASGQACEDDEIRI
jgi:1-acyl-sn-glycerol-3-phosphate acyltransferase